MFNCYVLFALICYLFICFTASTTTWHTASGSLSLPPCASFWVPLIPSTTVHPSALRKYFVFFVHRRLYPFPHPLQQNINIRYLFKLCIIHSRYSSQFQEGTGPYSTGVSTTSCTPGTLTSGTDGLYLGALNMFRSFAGLSSVSSNPAQDNATQACALICQANNNIQHSWSASATCYTTLGNNGCGSSNLLGGGTVTPADAIADWVNDMNNVDNPNNLGHRLWCLSPTLGGVSMGITTNFASLYVFGTQNPASLPGN